MLAVSPSRATGAALGGLDQHNPLGLCNNILFGGLAMFVSQLSGNIRIEFSPPVNNVAQLRITHPGGMHADPVVERAPVSYQFPVTGARFTDELRLARGEVDLTTGEARKLDYRLCVESNIPDA